MDNVLIAFSLTLFAGLSTGIGSLIAFFGKETNKTFLAAALGFSAGVMIYVSFTEILGKAQLALTSVYGNIPGKWYTALSFFGGVFLTLIIDRLVPSYENPHEIHSQKQMEHDYPEKSKLMRMGVFTALAIAIHNFPEGLATFSAALRNPTQGVAIAIAIAIHNVPEGISVSVPVYYATESKKKAFWYSFFSGIAEPVGAVIGYLIFRQLFSDTMFGILFAAVAGIMIFVSLDELVPTAREYDSGHYSIYGLIVGMAVMAVSLLLFL